MARSNPDTYNVIPCVAKIVKILIAELADRLEADSRHGASHKPTAEFDGADDVEEWEDVDENSEDEFNGFDGILLHRFLYLRIWRG